VEFKTEQMNTSISAVVITFNEGHHLEKCLRALQQVADEIIVVDSYSTDNTVEVAKDCGATVFQQNWKGYSEQKNDGNSMAKYNWILSIDADEVLDSELIESISNWKKNAPTPAAFKRMTNYCGRFIKHGGWYPDIKTRVFNKTQAKWEGTIHEILPNINKEDVSVLNGHCLHYSYYTVEQHYAQADKFTSIQALDLFNKGKKSPLFKRIFSPFAKFCTDYFFRLGFLDGRAGFIIARISAYATHLKYKKLHEHWVSK
jgi:glycosyltransferase involved in cell wall biosynthesis